MRGSRVQAVVNELQGEKIDIIPWTHDPANFVVNALAPAEVAKVVLDEDRQRMEVVVPDQQLSLAIGRRGQNVRLASQLTGWDIDIVTEQEESENRQAEFEKRTKLFIDSLNVDEVVGQLLASEGFKSVEELAMVDEKEIAGIEGFDEETAGELQNRAREFLAAQEAELDAKRKELGVEDALQGGARRHHRDAGQARRGRHQDASRTWPAAPPTISSGWSERKDGETTQLPRHPRRLRAVARRSRGADHAGPRQGRLGQGRRPRAAGGRGGPPRKPNRRRREEAIGPMMLAQPLDDALDAGPRKTAHGTERLCASTGKVRPIDDMIRFVVSPEGSRRSRSEAAAAGTRRLDHGDADGARQGDRAQGIRAQLQARRADRARSRGLDRAAARTGRARRAGDRLQGRPGGGGLRQGRGRAGRRRCGRRCCMRRMPPPTGSASSNATARRNTDDRRVHRGS